MENSLQNNQLPPANLSPIVPEQKKKYSKWLIPLAVFILVVLAVFVLNYYKNKKTELNSTELSSFFNNKFSCEKTQEQRCFDNNFRAIPTGVVYETPNYELTDFTGDGKIDALVTIYYSGTGRGIAFYALTTDSNVTNGKIGVTSVYEIEGAGVSKGSIPPYFKNGSITLNEGTSYAKTLFWDSKTKTFIEQQISLFDWKIYKNNEFGFQLTFTDQWKGYKVKEYAPGAMASYEPNAIAAFTFLMPTTDKELGRLDNGYYNMFSIIVFSKSGWQKETSQDGPKAYLLRENNSYVFAETFPQGYGNDQKLEALSHAMGTVIDSFALLNPQLGWKTYKNDTYGFEFQYNPNWSIAPINTGLGYNTSQSHVLLWAGTVSDAPCQDLGCPPKSGDRDELTKGDTFEGAPPLNPWFKILRVRGDKWVSIQVTDVNKNCSSEAVCRQYLSSAPLTQKLKVNSTGYQTYNDFIDLLSTLKFTN